MMADVNSSLATVVNALIVSLIAGILTAMSTASGSGGLLTAFGFNFAQFVPLVIGFALLVAFIELVQVLVSQILSFRGIVK